MNNIIVKFTNEEDFLEELHKDLEEYAVKIVETVRVSQVALLDGNVYVIVSYIRNSEIVKLFDYIGAVGDPEVVKKAYGKIEYYKDLIKTEEIEVKNGEYEDEEDSMYGARS